MNGKLNAVLTYFGLGAFLGFLVVFFGYAPSRDYLSYSILLGAAVGVALGLYLGRTEFSVAPAASLMGVVFTAVLILSWAYGGGVKSLDYIFAFLALVVAFVTKPTDLSDAILGFSNYVGGFAAALLLFRGFEPFQEAEGGLFSVIKGSGRIALFLVSGALMRWGFERFGGVPKDNV
ncbi:hypothetical protein [Thermococcus peptonophilus]|uniref:DUF4203 domain-containing protein n=1 Tax=Thermococcus peptonophilus TaxID=53952 RepID=A0A142CWR3_9EURY|nr:hypothetical protein [Thermococcus peptonophilus]AMQ19215.1 hypothetical protein A0127_08580 [Thermococcus peptonophilus]